MNGANDDSNVIHVTQTVEGTSSVVEANATTGSRGGAHPTLGFHKTPFSHSDSQNRQLLVRHHSITVAHRIDSS